MTTKKAKTTEQQKFKKFYIATNCDFSEGTEASDFYEYFSCYGATHEEAAKIFKDTEECHPKFIYEVTKKLTLSVKATYK